jgi:hypothetical protein
MRYILLRDDDTNALTPVSCLETLYRPFLDLGLPVNLATIPEVRADARTPGGAREGFLPPRADSATAYAPLAENRELTRYLHANPGFHILQHGCHHDPFEFDIGDRAEVARRLDLGRQRLRDAGFDRVSTFVAPHDKLSRVAYAEVARRFAVISTGWFEWRRLPFAWRPRYLLRKLLRRPHWRAGGTRLLGHPGCILSTAHQPRTILPLIKRAIARQSVTVLVTHWWEYFRNGKTDLPFVRALHDTAGYLASNPDVRVISFASLAAGAAGSGANLGGPPAPAVAKN